MKLTVNKKILVGVVLLIVAVALVALTVGIAKAQPSSVTTQATATATTTVTYMTPGTATTTYQFDNPVFSVGKIANMTPIDGGSLYIQLAASSSNATLAWRFQCSNNNIDWYDAEASTTPGSLTASTTRIVTPISSCVTYHERVVFTMPVSGSTGTQGSVYAEVDLKKNPSTP